MRVVLELCSARFTNRISYYVVVTITCLVTVNLLLSPSDEGAPMIATQLTVCLAIGLDSYNIQLRKPFATGC